MYDTAEHQHTIPDPIDGRPWKCVWVRGGPKLSQHDRDHIVRLIIMMSYKDQQQEDFKGDSCEGRVITKGKVSGLGHFYGIVYELHLETESGNIDGRVLLCGTNSRARKAALN